MNPPHPSREVTLVGKTSSNGDLPQFAASIANELDRALQSEVHHVAMGRHPDGAAEHPGEVKRAPRREAREGGHLDGLVQVGHDVVPDPGEHVSTQGASGSALD